MEKKKILLIGTGGTIASEMGENGLSPELTSEQLLKYIPDISGMYFNSCSLVSSGEDTLRGLFLREMKGRYDAASSEAAREEITLAVRFGLAAMEGRDIG